MAKDKSKKDKPEKGEKKQGRIRQMAVVYSMTKETDPKIGLILGGVFAVTAVVAFVALFFLLGGGIVFPIITAVLFGVLAALIVFGRRAQKSQYAQIEGKPGAAAAALNQLRRGWKVDAAIAVNRNQDLVHRVVGPPGIVLVGEGNPNRLRSLMANERRKHERVASETPIHEILCGTGEGAVPVPKLTRTVTKLGRSIKPSEMTDVLQRLKALDANRSNLPIPKGPVPTSMKGARQNMRGR
jgi:hypothetical protein